MRRVRSAAITAFILICGLVFAFEFDFPDVEASFLFPREMPIVYVDPQNASAAPGETFSISVRIFNLSNNFYATDESWDPGEELGPPGGQYNYSLGNLFGLDIRLSWSPAILAYVNHTVKIPVEHFPDGVLHKPIWDVKDEIDQEAGTYWIAKTSQNPAEPFNCPGLNATIFTMTFSVREHGTCAVSLDSVDLATFWIVGVMLEIPHWSASGQFQYPVLNPYCPADINYDFKVDIYDAVLICGAYTAKPSDPNWDRRCDIAEPYGVVDIYDIVLVCGHYGEEYTL